MLDELSEKRTITLPAHRQAGWEEVIPKQLTQLSPGIVELDCTDWQLNCKELKRLLTLFDQASLKINTIHSSIPETIVSASSLGYRAYLTLQNRKETFHEPTKHHLKKTTAQNVAFHQGTLRSGEQLEAETDILLLGDVNPGAKISAGRNVMIWGRLLGTAHAGKSGDPNAKIIALQFRPVQLRIANKVARGPEDKPQEGLAEEAVIESGQIVIKPARPNTFKAH